MFHLLVNRPDSAIATEWCGQRSAAMRPFARNYFWLHLLNWTCVRRGLSHVRWSRDVDAALWLAAGARGDPAGHRQGEQRGDVACTAHTEVVDPPPRLLHVRRRARSARVHWIYCAVSSTRPGHKLWSTHTLTMWGSERVECVDLYSA